MVEEISAACRASMGLAFKESLDPKHAGGDRPPTPPLADQAPPLITSPQVKISSGPTQKRVLLVTSFQAPHMHSLCGLSDPVLMAPFEIGLKLAFEQLGASHTPTGGP